MQRGRFVRLSTRGRCGFTLVEMLLVIVIIGVVSAISVPSFVKSMRGNRLRTSARSVVAEGRDARSMAVMHQRAMAITFNLDEGSFVIAAARSAPSVEDAEASVARGEEDPVPLPAAEEPVKALTGSDAGVSGALKRTLDEVTIASVNVSGKDDGVEGSCAVVYQSNGRCAPYEVHLVDREDSRIVIKVDALGSAITVRGER